MFGNCSEKLPPVVPGMTPADLYGGEVVVTPSSTVVVSTHERKVAPKSGHGREPLPEGLPVEEILLDVSEEEKICAGCGTELVRIGEDVRAEFQVMPHAGSVGRQRRSEGAEPRAVRDVAWWPDLPGTGSGHGQRAWAAAGTRTRR